MDHSNDKLIDEFVDRVLPPSSASQLHQYTDISVRLLSDDALCIALAHAIAQRIIAGADTHDLDEEAQASLETLLRTMDSMKGSDLQTTAEQQQHSSDPARRTKSPGWPAAAAGGDRDEEAPEP